MSSDPGWIGQMARSFYEIHREKHPLPPTPERLRHASLDDAYAVQEALQAMLAPERGEIAGYKIAITTPVMQQLMAIDQPLVGAIFARTIHQSPARSRHGDHRRIAVECEIALRLGADLPARSQSYTDKDVAAAVDACLASIELIEDHGCDTYKEVGARALIANNAWNAGCVLGAPVTPWRGLDLAAATGTMAINGKEIGKGRGGDVLGGHPLHVLAFVANTLSRRGRGLRRGMIVQTGSVVATQWPRQGDEVRVTFTGLGEARVRFE